MELQLKLLCTDFDGTLFSEHEEPPIPLLLQNMVRQLQSSGMLWIINTGRDLSSLMEEIGRAEIGIWPDYVVVVEREIYYRRSSTYISYNAWNHRCTLAHQELFQKLRPEIPKLHEWIQNHFNVTVYEDPYSPFCLVARNNKQADLIHSHLEDYCRQFPGLTVVRNDVYSRFSHKDFNKGTALGEIAKIEGITPDQILAAGDHYNDLPMLDQRFAQRLIAPANAITPVKEAVSRQDGYISHQIAGHGLARGLEFFCFGF